MEYNSRNCLEALALNSYGAKNSPREKASNYQFISTLLKHIAINTACSMIKGLVMIEFMMKLL